MGDAKGKPLTREELKKLAALYRPIERGRLVARLDELRAYVHNLSDEEFDALIKMVQRFRPR